MKTVSIVHQDHRMVHCKRAERAMALEKYPESVCPPAPPTERRTVKHLASQLEYRIRRHSGYVPKKAVPIAFFYYYPTNRKATHQPWFLWKWFCRSAQCPAAKQNIQQIEVRRLDESEW